jgi:hypothetical protein
MQSNTIHERVQQAAHGFTLESYKVFKDIGKILLTFNLGYDSRGEMMQAEKLVDLEDTCHTKAKRSRNLGTSGTTKPTPNATGQNRR